MRIRVFLSFISFNLFFLPVNSDPLFDKGKDIFFNIAVCSTCHTLADAGSDGQIGPNLNDIRPDKMRVVNAVTSGIGVMPAYEGMWISSIILLPLGVFLTYKATTDSVILNIDTYFEFFKKIYLEFN